MLLQLYQNDVFFSFQIFHYEETQYLHRYVYGVGTQDFEDGRVLVLFLVRTGAFTHTHTHRRREVNEWAKDRESL